MSALKNHLLVEDKNTLAPIVKTVLALQVCQARVKRRKPVLIVFEVIRLKKVAMQAKLRAQALEIQTPTLHVAFDVASNKQQEQKTL